MNIKRDVAGNPKGRGVRRMTSYPTNNLRNGSRAVRGPSTWTPTGPAVDAFEAGILEPLSCDFKDRFSHRCYDLAERAIPHIVAIADALHKQKRHMREVFASAKFLWTLARTVR